MIVVVTSSFTFLNNDFKLLQLLPQVEAISASPQPYEIQQPFGGKTISLLLRGNEVHHHEETIDGTFQLKKAMYTKKSLSSIFFRVIY